MSSPDPKFTWTDAYKLGYDRMDDTHRDFVVKVNALLEAGSADVMLMRLDDFIAHAVAHFDEEANWMTSTGFPPTQCHIDEHEAVMKSVREVRELLVTQADARSLEVARSLAVELTRWFPGHATYLDSSLAQWMAKRAFGGVPVVFRRS